MEQSLDILRWSVRPRQTDTSKVMFPVTKQKVIFWDPLLESTVNGDRGAAIIREDQSKILSHVSSNYQLVPHSTVLATVDAVLQAHNIDFEIYDVHTGGNYGASMYVNYLLKEFAFDIEGDKFTPFIQVYNSYDKLLSFGTITGVYRDACWNGNLWGTRDMQLIKNKHVGAAIDLAELGEHLEFRLETWRELLHAEAVKVGRLLHEELSETFIEDFLAKILENKRDRAKIVDLGLIESHRREFGDNKYALFNAATAYATHILPTYRTAYDNIQRVQKAITNFFLN